MSTAMGDGSGQADRREVVVIDATDELDKLRYRCPNGHSNFAPTNNHIWCQSCSRQAQHDEAVSAEHYEILDSKTDEEIPWSAVRYEG